MKTIHVLSITNETATNEAGEALGASVLPELTNRNTVSLDFSGTGAISTSFLNSSIGAWIEELGVETVKEFVKFTGLTKYQAQTLQKYLQDIQRLPKSA